MHTSKVDQGEALGLKYILNMFLRREAGNNLAKNHFKKKEEKGQAAIKAKFSYVCMKDKNIKQFVWEIYKKISLNSYVRMKDENIRTNLDW